MVAQEIEYTVVASVTSLTRFNSGSIPMPCSVISSSNAAGSSWLLSFKVILKSQEDTPRPTSVKLQNKLYTTFSTQNLSISFHIKKRQNQER